MQPINTIVSNELHEEEEEELMMVAGDTTSRLGSQESAHNPDLEIFIKSQDSALSEVKPSSPTPLPLNIKVEQERAHIANKTRPIEIYDSQILNIETLSNMSPNFVSVPNEPSIYSN